MNIAATIRHSRREQELTVSTQGNGKTIAIPAKTEGYGSSVNGGELLFLALATCFCNDVYREAAKTGMEIQSVEVTVSGEFGTEGEPAKKIGYHATIEAPGHSDEEISELMRHVDSVAEIHNTLRRGIDVSLIHNPSPDDV